MTRLVVAGSSWLAKELKRGLRGSYVGLVVAGSLFLTKELRRGLRLFWPVVGLAWCPGRGEGSARVSLRVVSGLVWHSAQGEGIGRRGSCLRDLDKRLSVERGD